MYFFKFTGLYLQFFLILVVRLYLIFVYLGKDEFCYIYKRLGMDYTKKIERRLVIFMKIKDENANFFLWTVPKKRGMCGQVSCSFSVFCFEGLLKIAKKSIWFIILKKIISQNRKLENTFISKFWTILYKYIINSYIHFKVGEILQYIFLTL